MNNKRAKKMLTLALDESGATTLVFAFIFTVLCGLLGLALDIGHIVTAKSELQRTADAAALAGAMGVMPYNNPGINQTPNWLNGQSKAHGIINNAANKVDNHTFSLTDGTVKYGYWCLEPPAGYVQNLPQAPPSEAYLPEPAVNVTLSRNVTLYLAPLVGVSSPKTVSATATAILPEAYSITGLPPVAVAWETVYNSNGGTVTIDINEQTIKPQSNGGIAGWYNLDGGNSVPSVRNSAPLSSPTSKVYMVPGTKASLMDFFQVGQTYDMPVVQTLSQKVWEPVIGFAAFHIDSLSSNSMTGAFVDQYFDPNVIPTAASGTIGSVAGTPKLVSQ